jgi:hypothetical protein
MDNKLVVFFGEKRRLCASSPDNILGGEHTPEIGDAFSLGTWQSRW